MAEKGIVDIIMDDMSAQDAGLERKPDVTDVIKEVNDPTAEGKFGGTELWETLVYFSPLLPEGSEVAENVPYNSDTYMKIQASMTGKGNNDDVKEVQELLADIGYYDGEIDGLLGRKTIGAANRYLINKTGEHNDFFFNELKGNILKYIGM
jgi:hypothetical protein